MFANAIELVEKFTRPIKFITRNHKGTNVIPGAATLFFVNDDGYAVTCKHVAEQISLAEHIKKNYKSYKEELNNLPKDNKQRAAIKKLEQKYGLNSRTPAQMEVQWTDCVANCTSIQYKMHPKHDVAIIKFNGFDRVCYSGHAVFAKDCNAIRRGDQLCRIGFPFPEFRDFGYDATRDELFWDATKKISTPLFPLDGMFTRQIVNQFGEVFGIELSTPGLRGQSGGPLFAQNGLIYGMQFSTRHLHLGFDMVDENMMINGRQMKINNQPFLHVGMCVNAEIIKDFLNENKIKYYVGTDPSNEEVVNG